MIIKNITFNTTDTKCRLSADIQYNGEKPQRMYFQTQKRYESFIAQDGSPFVAAILLPCLKRNENIHVEGNISQAFSENIQDIMNILVSWKVGFKHISVTSGTIPDTFKAKNIGTFFSAGVDSFYTYLKNKESSSEKITHLVTVHGFDIELKNNSLFRQALHNIKALAETEKVGVIPVETNMKDMVETYIEWDWGHGGGLGAVGLFLRRGLKRIYISANVAWHELFPYATHPDLDPHWGTETIEFIHEGNEYTRFQKIKYTISHSPLALKYLRVCGQNLKGTYNCSKCAKCLKTMIQLEAVDALDNAETFIKPLDLEKVKRVHYDFSLRHHYIAEEVLRELRKDNRKPKLQSAIAESLYKSKHPSLKRRLSDFIAHLDRSYNQRRIYKFVFRLNDNEDRNPLFKLLAQIGVIK